MKLLSDLLPVSDWTTLDHLIGQRIDGDKATSVLKPGLDVSDMLKSPSGVVAILKVFSYPERMLYPKQIFARPNRHLEESHRNQEM